MINDVDDDDWEQSVTNFTVEMENRAKVLESDLNNARDMFDDTNNHVIHDQVNHVIHDQVNHNTVTVAKTVCRAKRVYSEKEIERRIKKEEKKVSDAIAKKAKKAKNKDMDIIFGRAEDDEQDSYADFEDKYI